MDVVVLQDINKLIIEKPKPESKDVIKVPVREHPEDNYINGIFHPRIRSGNLEAVGMVGGCGAVQLCYVHYLTDDKPLIALKDYYEKMALKGGIEGVNCFVARLGCVYNKTTGEYVSRYPASEKIIRDFGFKEVALYKNEAHPRPENINDYQRLFVYTWEHKVRLK